MLVYIIGSERGWGQKVDGIKEFPTRQEAEAFVDKFNECNNKEEVPDWYMYAILAE